ncbi:hypothetical protein [Rhizobium binxianense]
MKIINFIAAAVLSAGAAFVSVEPAAAMPLERPSASAQSDVVNVRHRHYYREHRDWRPGWRYERRHWRPWRAERRYYYQRDHRDWRPRHHRYWLYRS